MGGIGPPNAEVVWLYGGYSRVLAIHPVACHRQKLPLAAISHTASIRRPLYLVGSPRHNEPFRSQRLHHVTHHFAQYTRLP